jgi:1-acyl-sn-glycerol-3-phosphate acyltransferase
MARFTGWLRTAGCMLASLVMAVSAICIVPFDPSGRTFHRNSRLWARMLVRLAGLRVTVRGLEGLPLPGRYVYVANHASALDIPVILASVPDEIRIVYKKELERIPFFGWGLRIGPYVGIDRGNSSDAMRSLEDAAARIRTGASALLYAEGTRTTDGRLQPFKRGAFNLAVKAGVPVVPLTINGSYGILPKDSLAIRPGAVEVVLAAPIAIEGTGKQAEMHLMERVHEAIARTYKDQD